MTQIVEENKLLGEEQFGFRKNRSTIDAAFLLTSLLRKAKRKRWKFATAFIDISKACILEIYSLIILLRLMIVYGGHFYSRSWREWDSEGKH